MNALQAEITALMTEHLVVADDKTDVSEEICWNHLQGKCKNKKCKRGDRCRYSHDPDATLPPPRNPTSSTAIRVPRRHRPPAPTAPPPLGRRQMRNGTGLARQ